jgi:hypothetical protein
LKEDVIFNDVKSRMGNILSLDSEWKTNLRGAKKPVYSVPAEEVTVYPKTDEEIRQKKQRMRDIGLDNDDDTELFSGTSSGRLTSSDIAVLGILAVVSVACYIRKKK